MKGLDYLHAFLWFIINAVNTPGVEDVLPAERPHDDVGTFQISRTTRCLRLIKTFSFSQKTVLSVALGTWRLDPEPIEYPTVDPTLGRKIKYQIK